MFRIEQPYILFLLPCICLTAWVYRLFINWRSKARASIAHTKHHERYFPNIFGGLWRPFFVWALICTFLVCSASDVRLGFRANESAAVYQTSVMLAVDLSTSMLAEDTPPNRLSFSKKMLAEWIKSAPLDIKIGLMGFAGTTQIETPPTFDRDFLLNRLQSIEPDQIIEQGTNLSLCFKNAQKILMSQEQTALLVLVTDAEDHSEDALEALAKMTEQGIILLPIGVGTTQGSPVPNTDQSGYLQDNNGSLVRSARNDDLLAQLGKTGGAQTFLLADGPLHISTEIERIRKKMGTGQLIAYRTNELKSYFAWFLIPAILLLLWQIWKGK
jgi:Ca-activated chloride channel homolog